MRGQGNQRAVTLLELLVVLFIISIIAGLSTVTFGNFTKGTRLNAAAERVSTVLRLAKSYAVSSGVNYSFNVDTVEFKEFWIVNDSTAEIIDKKYKLPDGVKFKSTTLATPIIFKPVVAQPNSVDIKLADAQDVIKKTITVSDGAARIIIE
ncbi:MAG: GspH/FimT family protein [Candidatus Omnitrophota bacterium]|nr:GspH/FimT family protein [Candidatus Omnitrophota bacterium]